MKLGLRLMFILITLIEAEALTCLRCTDTTRNDYNKLFPDFTLDESAITGNACWRPDHFARPREICPEDGDYVCGHMQVNIQKTVNTGLREKYNFTSGRIYMVAHYENYYAEMIIRKCMPAPVHYGPIDCTANYRTIRQELSQSLDVTEDYLRDMQINGSICYCKTSLCDPRCGDYGYEVLETCIPKWSVPAVLGSLLGIVLLSITACCCCCECCTKGCRKQTKTVANCGREQPYISSHSTRRPVCLYTPLDSENPAEGVDNPGF